MKTKESRKSHFYGVIKFFVLTLLFVGVYFVGFEEGKNGASSGDSDSLPRSTIFSSSKFSSEDRVDMSLFWKSWDLLHKRFIDRESLDETVLLYGAINGMLSATGDPYTTFFDPEENKAFDEEISGSFEGIGAEIGMKNKILTVIAPLDGSPAERAGLRSGDKIFEINDESTAELTIDESVKKMRGAKGTEVKLAIFREGDSETRDVVIVRDTIVVKSVKIEWKDNDIASVRITQFGDETTEEFKLATKEIQMKNAKGLVIDLRNNPGGLLRSAVDIGSLLIPKGKTIVIEEDSEKKRDIMEAFGGDVLSGLPTVVLINEGSASAAEILAGALRENRENVTLVGKKSFGKGSVQELLTVSKDTSLKVTMARWLTPNGNQINKKGINPDEEVDRTNDDYEAERDPQFDRAMEIVREKIR